MTQHTRFVRLADGASRLLARNEGTQCFGGPAFAGSAGVRLAFNLAQPALAGALADERRAGLFVFALGFGHERPSRAWLSATDALRAMTFGRHGKTDLFVPGNDGLSLRHGLVLVRRMGERVRTHVIDLDSQAGLRLPDGQAVQAAESDGAFLLEVPNGALAFVPSGGGVPWDRRALDAYATLPSLAVRTVARPPRPSERTGAGRAVTQVFAHPGPTSFDPRRQALAPGEAPLGVLELRTAGGVASLPLGALALEKGVLLGRYERCLFSEQLERDPMVSRVHALLVIREGQLLVVDAGSSNSLHREGQPVRCEALTPRAGYALSPSSSVRWLPRGVVA